MSVEEKDNFKNFTNNFLVEKKENGINFFVDNMLVSFIPKNHNFSDEQIEEITQLIAQGYKKGYNKGQLDHNVQYSHFVDKLFEKLPMHQRKHIKEEKKKRVDIFNRIEFIFSKS